jgi:hypothetical protein
MTDPTVLVAVVKIFLSGACVGVFATWFVHGWDDMK